MEEAQRVKQVGTRGAGSGGPQWPRWLGVLALGAVLVAGCAAFRREPLDVPPGHQIVLGEILLWGFSEQSLRLDFARDDGTFRLDVSVGAGRSPLVITLPPGRYQVVRLRINDIGRTFPMETSFPVGVVFEVGRTAAYVGTLEIERARFGSEVRVEVRDDYERTVSEMRGRYPELPPVVVRALMRTS
ncbi:MAG TPA: hypothetical protein VHO73_07775 [Methylomirabilota bacterium]|jgi:hypothetical protein|nr:hypothetical protein [Methylomirabilota bacterium]